MENVDWSILIKDIKGLKPTMGQNIHVKEFTKRWLPIFESLEAERLKDKKNQQSMAKKLERMLKK